MHPRTQPGLSPAQIRFLRGLSPIACNEAQTQTSVYPLVKLGLVQFCEPLEEDIGRLGFRLTPKGQRLVARIRPPVQHAHFRA